MTEPCSCRALRKIAVICTAAMTLGIVSLECVHYWAVGRHEDLRREVSAIVARDAREIDYAAAHANALIYWYEACQQKAASQLCFAAQEMRRIKHEDYAGAGAERYAREPAFQFWMKASVVQ